MLCTTICTDVLYFSVTVDTTKLKWLLHNHNNNLLTNARLTMKSFKWIFYPSTSNVYKNKKWYPHYK